jgi:hypothetical protein
MLDLFARCEQYVPIDLEDMSMRHYTAEEWDHIRDLRKHDFDPIGDKQVDCERACEAALNALDELAVMAATAETAHLVIAQRIFIGQILRRAQTVAGLLMAKQADFRSAGR